MFLLANRISATQRPFPILCTFSWTSLGKFNTGVHALWSQALLVFPFVTRLSLLSTGHEIWGTEAVVGTPAKGRWQWGSATESCALAGWSPLGPGGLRQHLAGTRSYLAYARSQAHSAYEPGP